MGRSRTPGSSNKAIALLLDLMKNADIKPLEKHHASDVRSLCLHRFMQSKDGNPRSTSSKGATSS